MAQDMKVLVIHDNQEVLRDIAVILGFLGENVVGCSLTDWKSSLEGAVDDSSQLNVIFIGSDDGQVSSLVKELHDWDEGVPCLALGDVDLIVNNILLKWEEVYVAKLNYLEV